MIENKHRSDNRVGDETQINVKKHMEIDIHVNSMCHVGQHFTRREDS